MALEKEINDLVKNVNALKKKDKIDLSSDEDLSIAIMNLISIEEHLYFSGMKTDKKIYFELLESARELRKKLLKEIVRKPEAEVWCLSKHLLAASMRLIEVGNKYLSKKDEEKAHDKFKDAFYLYSLFWTLNLKIVKSEQLVKGKSEGWKDKISGFVKKAIDCCIE